MRTRELLPGATIAALLTASALLALLVGLGMRGNGPLALDLGGSDGSAQLRGGEGQGAGATAVGGRRPASLTLPSVVSDSDVAASVPGSAGRRRTAALQGAAGRERAAARRQATTPALRTPAAPTAPTKPATRPAATSTPNPVAVKVRGRGAPAPKQTVSKTRVPTSPSGTAAPRSSTPAPSAPAPAVPVERVTAPATPTPTPPVVVVRVP
jgi:hypothetical protein